MKLPANWTWLGRRLALDHNPLRRRTDVVAAWLLPGAIASFLVLAPLTAVTTTLWMHAAGAREQYAQWSW
jgi:hypothetical protein